MIGAGTLETAGVLFGSLAVGVFAAWLGHAAWATSRSRRIARLKPDALRALAAALQGGEAGPAFAALGRLGPEGAIDALVEMSSTVAGEQRARLDEIAGRYGIVARAERWAGSRRWPRRLRAARLIALFGTGAEAAGDRLLVDPHPDVRAQAAEWAGAHPAPSRIRRLIEMLGDEDLRCRFTAREALVDAGRAAIVELREALARLSAERLRGALETARDLAVPDFLPDAIRLTEDADAAVRERATALAGAIGGAGAVEALVLRLRDPDPRVRATAAFGLGHLGQWQAAGRIASLLDDPEWRTRRAAALALRRVGPTGELLLRRAGRAGGEPAFNAARSALELPPADAAEARAA